VGVLPAGHGIALIGGARNNRAVAARILIAPAHGSARRARLKCPDLRLVGTGAILLIKRSADPIADQPANGCAGRGARYPAASAPKLRAHKGAADCAHERACILMRPRAGLRVSRASTRQ